MSKVKIASIIYVIGIIIGALFFDVWGAETTPQKTISVFIWTVIFIITLFLLIKMKENNFLFVLLLFFFTCFKLNAEIIVLSKCDHKEDRFLKNEYILNLNELTMTRNYVYNEKTYKKYRITDLSVKKSNLYVRNIYEEEGKILTLKHGYPQFYTQILFEKYKQEIFIKAVLNDVESVSKVSTCKKMEKFDHQS